MIGGKFLRNKKEKYAFAETKIINLVKSDVIVTSVASGDDMDSKGWDKIEKN